ncbi:hypothetical protein PTKIN_Ptkin02bG0033600 [Pterospermum kingtungense]
MDREGQRMKNSDIISNLPDNITERILARLPIQDAVRTSVLSRNWRYKWTTLPDLVFDARGYHYQWYLRLCRCIIPSHPPTFVGFNDLTYLSLERVFVNNEGFHYLFSKCPKLNALHLLYIDGLDRLNIDYAPKIETLSFVGSLNFCLKNINTPPLIHSTIFFTQLPDMNDNIGNERSVSLINNLNFLSDLRSFTTGSYFLKFLAEGSVTKLLPSTFKNLCDVSFLKLMFEDVDSLSSVLGLITSSPSLRKLVITASRATNSAADHVLETVAEYLEGESRSIGCLMQLRYVEMKYIVGVGPEMELMKLILGKSPSLELMKIAVDETVDVLIGRESK